MTARREDNAVRGVVYALVPALGAWVVLFAVLSALVVLMPAWALWVLAVALLVAVLTMGLVAWLRTPKK